MIQKWIMRVRVVIGLWPILDTIRAFHPFESMCTNCGSHLHRDWLVIRILGTYDGIEYYWPLEAFQCSGCGIPMGLIKGGPSMNVTNEFNSLRKV